MYLLIDSDIMEQILPRKKQLEEERKYLKNGISWVVSYVHK